MGLGQLTVLMITYNEKANIRRTLESLHWAPSILVIDSFSTDGTMDILENEPNVRVVQRAFNDFAGQCNFGLSQVETQWVLSIDADYVFPAGSEAAVSQAINGRERGFRAQFDYCIEGQTVRGSILPPRTVLYRREDARYVNDGHGHRVAIAGPIGSLPFKIRHDDRKPLSRWLQSQITYARQEAEKLSTMPAGRLGRNDRVRKAIAVAPLLVFLLVYLFRGGFISGWRGLFYAMQRTAAELLLSLFLLDAKLKRAASDESGKGDA